jgi:hypothetical protein
LYYILIFFCSFNQTSRIHLIVLVLLSHYRLSLWEAQGTRNNFTYILLLKLVCLTLFCVPSSVHLVFHSFIHFSVLIFYSYFHSYYHFIIWYCSKKSQFYVVIFWLIKQTSFSEFIFKDILISSLLIVLSQCKGCHSRGGWCEVAMSITGADQGTCRTRTFTR